RSPVRFASVPSPPQRRATSQPRGEFPSGDSLADRDHVPEPDSATVGAEREKTVAVVTPEGVVGQAEEFSSLAEGHDALELERAERRRRATWSRRQRGPLNSRATAASWLRDRFAAGGGGHSGIVRPRHESPPPCLAVQGFAVISIALRFGARITQSKRLRGVIASKFR